MPDTGVWLDRLVRVRVHHDVERRMKRLHRLGVGDHLLAEGRRSFSQTVREVLDLGIAEAEARVAKRGHGRNWLPGELPDGW